MITPAFAQAAGAASSTTDFMSSFIFLLPIFAIFYFFMLRPQQRRIKEHEKLVNAIKRGDTVVTSGGFIGKVTKAVEGTPEVEVEIADGVKVKVVRSAIAEVRSKTEPAKTDAA